MAISKGNTQSTIYMRLRQKAREYVATMSWADALAKAREEVSKEMDDLGPDENNLVGTLKSIYETQRTFNPGMLRPRLLDHPEEIQERLAYSKLCREAYLTVLSERVTLDLTFAETANNLFEPADYCDEMDQRRWLQFLIKLPPKDGSEQACRDSNETLIFLVAYLEHAITPETFLRKRQEWYVRHGKNVEEAAVITQEEMAQAPKLLYDMLAAQMHSAQECVNEIRENCFRILDGQGKLNKEQLLDAYRKADQYGKGMLMFNAKNCLLDLQHFGLPLTEYDIAERVQEWEGGSLNVQPYQLMATFIANPYYSILDQLELRNGHVQSIIAQPGQNADYSYLYDGSGDIAQGIFAVDFREKQALLARFGLENRLGFLGNPQNPPHDPNIEVLRGGGRTLIYVSDNMTFQNGQYHSSIQIDIPGRYMDAELLSDIEKLRTEAASLPKPPRSVRSAFRELNQALDAMSGKPLGDHAEDERMKDLNARLTEIQKKAASYTEVLAAQGGRAAAQNRGEKTPEQRFLDHINSFVSDKLMILETIRAHKETIRKAEEIEAKEAAEVAAGKVIPENDRALTPMQRYLRPIEAERNREAARKAAEEAQRKKEAEDRQLAEDQKEGDRAEAILHQAEKDLSAVQVNGIWERAAKAAKDAAAEDPVNAMISDFVQANVNFSRDLLELNSPEEAGTAVHYSLQALAGETVREMLILERKYGNGKDRLEQLLKKGSLTTLVGMVMESDSFKRKADGLDLTKPGILEERLSKKISFSGAIALDLMRGIQVSQRAKEAAKAKQPKKKENKNLPNANEKEPQAAPVAQPGAGK